MNVVAKQLKIHKILIMESNLIIGHHLSFLLKQLKQSVCEHILAPIKLLKLTKDYLPDIILVDKKSAINNRIEIKKTLEKSKKCKLVILHCLEAPVELKTYYPQTKMHFLEKPFIKSDILHTLNHLG